MEINKTKRKMLTTIVLIDTIANDCWPDYIFGFAYTKILLQECIVCILPQFPII